MRKVYWTAAFKTKTKRVVYLGLNSMRVESRQSDIPPYISCLLLPFQEEAKSVAMILHSMNTVKRLVEFLNPSQTPVTACDQPLYAIAKKIQWQWPETLGEKKFVVVLG